MTQTRLRRAPALLICFVATTAAGCGTDNAAEGPITSTNADAIKTDTLAAPDTVADAGVATDTQKPQDSGVSASSGGGVDTTAASRAARTA